MTAKHDNQPFRLGAPFGVNRERDTSDNFRATPRATSAADIASALCRSAYGAYGADDFSGDPERGQAFIDSQVGADAKLLAAAILVAAETISNAVRETGEV